MFSPNKCPWGAGASKEMPVPLVFDLCVIVGCGQHQNSIFPTWPQYAILLPTRSSSCLLAIFLSLSFFFSGNNLIWGKVWAGLFHLGW